MFYNKDNWRSFISDPISSQSRALRYYDELATRIRQLTGYSLETLERMFAAGYTLTPPDYSSSPSLSKLAENVKIKIREVPGFKDILEVKVE